LGQLLNFRIEIQNCLFVQPNVQIDPLSMLFKANAKLLLRLDF